MAGLLFRYHFQACYRNTVRDLALWRRTYHCSSIYLLGEHSEASETEPSDDKKTPNVQSLQFSGYSGLIDLAKQKPGIKKSEQFALALNEFTTREKYRKGHVPFIRVAMQRMEEFELEKDLVTYNKILEIFPKGKYKPRKWIDAVWPRPTPPLELCLEILTKMEENGVRPSRETYFIIKAAFGRTLPLDKCVRIMHLFDKYQDADPYEIRGGVPTDSVELCRLALFRITGGGAQLMEIKVQEGGDVNRFIIAGNSERQLEVLERLESEGLSSSTLLHVEGPHRLWLKKMPQFYFSLRVSENVECSEEELSHYDRAPERPASQTQPNSEGHVLGVCMCSAGQEKASLQAWIGELQEKYPSLSKATIIYDITESEIRDSVKDSNRLKQAQLAS